MKIEYQRFQHPSGSSIFFKTKTKKGEKGRIVRVYFFSAAFMSALRTLMGPALLSPIFSFLSLFSSSSCLSFAAPSTSAVLVFGRRSG